MFFRSVPFRMCRTYARVNPQDSTSVMKSSMRFSKKTLFSQSVSSASISSVLRRIVFRQPLLARESMSVYQCQGVLGDLRGGVGPTHAACRVLHLLQPGRVSDEAVAARGKCLFQGLRRANMPRAGRCRQK